MRRHATRTRLRNQGGERFGQRLAEAKLIEDVEGDRSGFSALIDSARVSRAHHAMTGAHIAVAVICGLGLGRTRRAAAVHGAEKRVSTTGIRIARRDVRGTPGRAVPASSSLFGPRAHECRLCEANECFTSCPRNVEQFAARCDSPSDPERHSLSRLPQSSAGCSAMSVNMRIVS